MIANMFRVASVVGPGSSFKRLVSFAGFGYTVNVRW